MTYESAERQPDLETERLRISHLAYQAIEGARSITKEWQVPMVDIPQLIESLARLGHLPSPLPHEQRTQMLRQAAPPSIKSRRSREVLSTNRLVHLYDLSYMLSQHGGSSLLEVHHIIRALKYAEKDGDEYVEKSVERGDVLHTAVVLENIGIDPNDLDDLAYCSQTATGVHNLLLNPHISVKDRKKAAVQTRRKLTPRIRKARKTLKKG